MQQQWHEALGVCINLEACDWGVYLPKISQQDYEIGRHGWAGEYTDPSNYLEPYREKSGIHVEGNNATGWEDPRFAELLSAAEVETDGKKRQALLREAEALIIEQMPLIPLFFTTNAYLKQPYVHGVKLAPRGTIDFKEAWISL